MTTLKNDVGKIIWNRSGSERGIVKGTTYRRCACCGYGEVYDVEWPDGKHTKPCPGGVSTTANGDLIIK